MSPDEIHTRVRRAIAREAAQWAAHLAELRRTPLPPGRIDEPPDGPDWLNRSATRWHEPEAPGARRVGLRRIRRMIEKTTALRLGAPRRGLR